LLATDLAALDHHEGAVTLIANAVNWTTARNGWTPPNDDGGRWTG